METLLYQTLSSDDQVRRYATQELQRAQLDNYSYYAKNMCSILANEEFNDQIRLSAGLALKNSFSAGSQQFGWLYTDQRIKTEIKSKVLYLLGTEKRNVANVISQILATIAQVELPRKQWCALIDILLCNITSSNSNPTLKQTTLQTIGYICELIDPIILSKQQCDAILTAIIEGARREEPDINTRLVAMKALYNSLEFVKGNFENTIERDYIIKVVCDGATQHVHSNINLQISSYECLVKIMHLYYYKMEDSMSSCLFNLTIYGMNQSDERIKSQAIEFWCTICDLEIELKNDNNSSFCFANHSVTYILPSLLQLLVKNANDESHDDEDELNIPQQAANCLKLFAQCTTDAVVPQVVEFISNNLLVGSDEIYQSLKWNQKEASVIAFGCMIEGPCKFDIVSLVNQILPVLLACLNDKHTSVQIAASWTLSQIIKKTISVMDVPHVLHSLVPVVLSELHSENEQIVYNSCVSLINMSRELKPLILTNDAVDTHQKVVKVAETSPLSIFTKQILCELLNVTEVNNTPQNIKNRSAIYEAISNIITDSSKDCNEYVYIVTSTVIDRLQKLSSLLKMKEYQNDNIWNLQSNLLDVLSHCICRLKSEASEFSDAIMCTVYRTSHLYLSDPRAQNITVVEDAFLLVTALVNAIGKKFHRFIDQFLPDLSKVLAKQGQLRRLGEGTRETFQVLPATAMEEEARLSLISVGIISDISSTFGENIFPYAGEFMRMLINNLKSKSLHRDVKPVTLSCIGDVAQAMGPLFVQYVETVMMVLKQAGNMQADKDNHESIEYIDAIRVGTIEAFIGMTVGVSRNAATKEILLPFVTDFVFYISSIVMDPNRSDKLTRTIIGLLGDIARIYGKRVKHTLIETPLNHLVIENSKGELHFSKGTREIANWAQQVIITIYHAK